MIYVNPDRQYQIAMINLFSWAVNNDRLGIHPSLSKRRNSMPFNTSLSRQIGNKIQGVDDPSAGTDSASVSGRFSVKIWLPSSLPDTDSTSCLRFLEL